MELTDVFLEGLFCGDDNLEVSPLLHLYIMPLKSLERKNFLPKETSKPEDRDLSEILSNAVEEFRDQTF